MTLTTSPNFRTNADPSGLQIDQLYYTHCLYDEGLSREAGFGVRASSTSDPLLLRYIREYPSYEAPAGLNEENGLPHRLALVRVPGGRSALIHSVPRPKDESGRANNFFSHVVFAADIPPCNALASWGSTEWAISAGDADKELTTLDSLPRPGLIGDRTLTAFLQAPAPANPSCPPRLADDRDRRRRLLTLALRGCLQVLASGPSAPRGRFYLLAEPALVALLLYGAARLLPQVLVERLTFSTYENALTVLPSYRHAQVIGTWTANPSQGLSGELYTQRGYFLDTVNDQWSEELTRHINHALEEWVELAARGEWSAIDRLHGILGETTPGVVAYTEGVQASRLAKRLASGRATLDDVLAIKRSSWGAAILEQHHEEVRPIICEGSLADPAIREEFADILRRHIHDLESHAAQALRRHPPGEWQPYWRLLWELLQDQPAVLRDTFERILPELPCTPPLGFAILAELQLLQLSVADPRVPLQALLKNLGEEDLERFAKSTLPREWFVWAVCHALVRSETRDTAARYLHEDEELVRVFWHQFKLLKGPNQRQTILAALVATVGDRGAAFLDRMLASGCTLRPEMLTWLLEALGAWKTEWAEYWGRDDHLGQLLARIREFGVEGGPIWERFCSEIDRRVLPPGDPYQHTLLMNLVAVAKRPGPPLPGTVSRTIADWALLRDHFEKASALPPGESSPIITACNRRGLDPMAELATYFVRYIQPQAIRGELLSDFAGFFHSFYPEPQEYPDYEACLSGWLQIVSGCPDEKKREVYQFYYFDHHVPLDFRRRLAEEMHQTGKLLTAVYQAHQKPAEAELPKPRRGFWSLLFGSRKQ